MEETYLVTMTVEITRTVQAKSEKEALEKVDTSDIIYELKYCGTDYDLKAEKI